MHTQCSTAYLSKRDDNIKMHYKRPNLKVGSTNSNQGIQGEVATGNVKCLLTRQKEG